MKITPIPHGLKLAESDLPRSKGLHMSDIYGAYYAKQFKGQDEPPLVKFEEGFAFEEILEPAISRRLLGSRPKEQKCKYKGVTIYFSPDHILFISGETALGEFKYTRYSSRGAPRGKKFARWISQIKLYCYQLNLNTAYLYVMFVNGDYKPPTPTLLAWKLTFTDEELAEEWDIMMRFAEEEGLLGKVKSKR